MGNEASSEQMINPAPHDLSPKIVGGMKAVEEEKDLHNQTQESLGEQGQVVGSGIPHDAVDGAQVNITENGREPSFSDTSEWGMYHQSKKLEAKAAVKVKKSSDVPFLSKFRKLFKRERRMQLNAA